MNEELLIDVQQQGAIRCEFRGNSLCCGLATSLHLNSSEAKPVRASQCAGADEVRMHVRRNAYGKQFVKLVVQDLRSISGRECVKKKLQSRRHPKRLLPAPAPFLSVM